MLLNLAYRPLVAVFYYRFDNGVLFRARLSLN
jgi:hypothetical protein